MAVYGYHRTSTTEQHLDRGVRAIREFCAARGWELADLYTDQQTGRHFDRPEYRFMRRRLLPGDILILSELDRLGRNKEDTLKELRYFQERGVRVMILEIPTTLLDDSALDDQMANLILQTVNQMLIEMYAVFAQAEMEKREKRQREGIEAMKARGDWARYGRPRKLDLATFGEAYEKVKAGQMRPTACMRQLGLTKPTFYRYKQQWEREHQGFNSTDA